MSQVFRGHVFHVAGSTGLEDAKESLVAIPNGQVLVNEAGRITACGPRDDAAIPAGASIVEAPFVLPGLIDTHVHFPQLYAMDRYGGGQLLEWLDRCIFPAEARLADPAYGAVAAADFTDALARAGTTCALVFGSQFPVAQEALFHALSARGLRAIVGRTSMVLGPEALTTSIAENLRQCRDEIDRWHPAPDDLEESLLRAALIPRFALSFDQDGLRAFGELWEEMRERNVHFSTHLSENARPGDGEVAQVLATFGVEAYLDVYASFLSERSVFAHAVHCTDAEYTRLAAAGCGIAHCPTSQLFLGSGTMPMRRVRDHGVRMGLGTDWGAGDDDSIAQVANASAKVHGGADHPTSLHPAELLHLATLGGARVLRLDHRIGNLDAGKDADLVLVDPGRHPPLARRLSRIGAETTDDASVLFALLMGMGRDTIARTVVRGRTVYEADTR